MVVSNDCIFGSGEEEVTKEKYSIDGICGNDGNLYIYLKSRAGVRTLNGIAGPNYITGIDNKENKFFMIPDLQMYKGFFTADDPLNKQTIRYFMRIGPKFIYGFGRDAAGTYMVSGSVQDEPVKQKRKESTVGMSPRDENREAKDSPVNTGRTLQKSASGFGSPNQAIEGSVQSMATMLEGKMIQLKVYYVEGYQVTMTGKMDKTGEIVSHSNYREEIGRVDLPEVSSCSDLMRDISLRKS